MQPYEQMSQSAGWSWPSAVETDVCAPSHGFTPNWNKCGLSDWGVYYTGYFLAPNAGTYCFALNSTGIVNGLGLFCGSVLLNGDTNPVAATQETQPACVTASGGSSIQIDLYYQQMGSLLGGPLPLPVGGFSFDVLWCYASGAAASCDPNSSQKEIGPGLLRVTP
jgi:hypothetical protein